MKKSLMLFCCTVLIFCCCIGKTNSNKKLSKAVSDVGTCQVTENESVMEMLKNFYTEYITACCQFSNDDTMNSIIEKYCTNVLVDSIYTLKREDMLEVDPFLNAQDCDLETIKTLNVGKDARENVYTVSYNWPSGDCVATHVLVVNTDVGYRINALLNK